MNRFDAKAIIVMMLATLLGATVFTVILGVVLTGRSLSESSTETFAFIAGSIVTLISNYVAGRVGNGDHKPPPDVPPAAKQPPKE